MIRVAILTSVCFFWLTPLLALAAPAVQVVDEAGQPVPRFEFMVHTEGDGYTRWAADEEGTISWEQTFPRSPRVDVLLRADGFAPVVEIFAGSRLDSLRSTPFVLKRGTPVELRFRLPDGMTWPADKLPEAYFVDYEHRVR